MRTLLIVGDDKWSGHALEALSPLGVDIEIAVDASNGIKRIYRLFLKGRISGKLLCHMAFCSFVQRGRKPQRLLPRLRKNGELQSLMCSGSIERAILFRAGLIVNEATIRIGVPLYNIHCARLPEYGGLGAIRWALDKKDWTQCATLHKIDTSIDGGEVLDTEPYQLNPKATYCENEAIAYKAGIRLLLRTIAKSHEMVPYLPVEKKAL